MSVQIDIQDMAKRLGGRVVRGNVIECPGPSRKKHSTSLAIWVDPKHPEGFSVHSHTGRDWREVRDYVRETAGLPEWTPGDTEPQSQPVFAAHEYVYEDIDGEPYHRVVALSDGTFRHYRYHIDGWIDGAPDVLVPFALSDTQSDETIWIVRGEYSAQLIRDGFRQVATTYPSGLPVHADASFLYHLAGRDVRILDVGGARSAAFCHEFSQALGIPTYSLPDGVRTLTDFSRISGATLDQCAPVPGKTNDAPDIIDDVPEPTSIRATPFQWVDPLDIAPRAWLYGDHLIRRFVSVTVSPGGIGKSSLVMLEALCMASGQSLLIDDKVRTPDPLRVWYWNGEDPQDETQRRVIAAAIHHGLKPSDFSDRLFTDTGREQTITLGQIARGEITLDETLFDDLEREIIARGIDVFMLDPFVSSHRMGENDNNAIDAVIKRLGKLAERANCAVEIVHHVRKPTGGNTAQTDVNDARGASALIGGVRSARVLNVMSEDIANEIDGLSADDRFSYFTVTNGKANMTKRSGQGKWRQLIDVDLKNGPVGVSDRVGVVAHYNPPETASAIDAMPDDAVSVAQRAAYDNPAQSRLDPRSPEWFGHVIGRVMGINSVEKSGEKTIKQAIQIWIRNGALSVQIRPDAQRRPREYVVVPGSENAVSVGVENHDDSPF